jgi:hypothetical protein
VIPFVTSDAEAEVLVVDLPDTQGMLGTVSEALADARINIDYAYSSVCPVRGRERCGSCSRSRTSPGPARCSTVSRPLSRGVSSRGVRLVSSPRAPSASGLAGCASCRSRGSERQEHGG